jgi:UDP-N-acetylmuramoyl-tripeptide--D-alanyl-D-alanine ligase
MRSFRRWHPRVIVITGSVGKTTMLNLLVAQKLPAHFSHNANSAFGVAFDILGLEAVRGSRLRWIYLVFASMARSFTFTRRDKFYIVEVDAERPREADLIAGYLQPEVVLTTPIGLSHASFYETLVGSGKYEHALDAIYDEFVAVGRHAAKLALFSGRNPYLTPRVKMIKTEVDFVESAEIKNYRVGYDMAIFETARGEFRFHEPMPEEVGLQLLLCERLMQHLELPVVYDLADFVLPPGRNNYFEGIRGVKMIDSSYNAHLISMESVLRMTKKIRWNRKWLVISDMIQQGKYEKSEHEKLAEAILGVGAENVLLVGARTAKYTLPKLLVAGQKVEKFDDVREALQYLEKSLTGTELVVFKGSQYLEWLVEKLLANPADAAKLARREKAAVRRRAKRGLR